jgi:hypothetical protein
MSSVGLQHMNIRLDVPRIASGTYWISDWQEYSGHARRHVVPSGKSEAKLFSSILCFSADPSQGLGRRWSRTIHSIAHLTVEFANNPP